MNKDDIDINKTEDQEDNNSSLNSKDTNKEQMKELYRRIDELRSTNKKLEAFKQETESRKEIEQLYKQYLFSEDEQTTINTFLKKYNIKDYKGYIEDFYNFLGNKDGNRFNFIGSISHNRDKDQYSALEEYATNLTNKK